MALHVTTMGESGSPVVFLHGLFGQGRNWTTIGRAIAERHRVVLVDLPDHGRSGWTESFDLLAMTAAVAVAIDESFDGAQGPPSAVVGHSLGGKVAMLLALLHPEKVSRLVVADMSPVTYPSGGGGGRGFGDYIRALRSLDLASIHRREDADEALKAAIPSDGVRLFLLQNLRRDGEGWRWQMNLDVIERDLAAVSTWPEESLAGVAAYDGPVLWVAGERSDYVTDEYAPAMARWFPHYRKVTIKGAGHWVHSDQPEVFTQVLTSFLAG